MKVIDYLKNHTEWAEEDKNQPNRFRFRFMGEMFTKIIFKDSDANLLLNSLMNNRFKENKEV